MGKEVSAVPSASHGRTPDALPSPGEVGFFEGLFSDHLCDHLYVVAHKAVH
jgi:hypothetical protein